MKLMSIVGSMIGWLAPPICVSCGDEGHSLCEACAESEILPYGNHCWRCGKMTQNGRTCPACMHLRGPGHVWVTTNYENTAQDLLKLYKFGHQRLASVPITELMAETFLSFNSDLDIAKKNYLIVPIPTATTRIRERSFDHSSLLASKLAPKLSLEYKSAVTRLGQQRQVGSKRSDRTTQLEGKFYVSNTRLVASRNILLIDDVVTTGSTLVAATKSLRDAGAKHVDALVFAKKL